MKRITHTKSFPWFESAKALGIEFPTEREMRCTSDAYISLTPTEQSLLLKASTELYALIEQASSQVFKENRLSQFLIPEPYHNFFQTSWHASQSPWLGRFDFTFSKNGVPKLLEFNSDTPALLAESSLLQEAWRQSTFSTQKSWNDIEELFVPHVSKAAFSKLHLTTPKGLMYDQLQTKLIERLVKQAGKETTFFPLQSLSWDESHEDFVDDNTQRIEALYKFYPWEWMIEDDTSKHLPQSTLQWFEPPSRMLSSCKYMLALLWELFPEHDFLLPTFSEATPLGDSYVQKPYYSHRGEGIHLQKNEKKLSIPSPIQHESFVYQELCPLPRLGNRYCCVSVWMVGSSPAGIGIRESRTPVTDGGAFFIPHLIEDHKEA